jgi:GTP-binding protein EngB required for normal cell division
MLDDSGVVDVAVVGRFKAGKSSFLNSLIGRDLLPVAVLPVTAIVTRISHGPRDRLLVAFQDGTHEEVGVERLPEFVAEPQNPGNRKGVALVDVEVRDLGPYRGVRFVDTPGLGSAYSHNTQASLDWLPRVGAALLAVSVEHPLSADDLDLLRELRRHTPEIALLLADLVSPAELAEVQGFITTQLAQQDGGPLPILSYSVRLGFDGLRHGVEDYLRRRVVAAHTETAEQVLQHKLRALVAGCAEYLEVARAASAAAEGARARLRAQLAEERQSLSAVRNEIWLLAADVKLRVRSVSVGPPVAEQQLAAARGRAERVVQGFQDRLAQVMYEALGRRFDGARFEPALHPPRQPDLRLGRVFDTSLELVWFLVPMWLFRPRVRRHFLRLVAWEVEKNLHRLAGQWAEAVGRSVDDLATRAGDFIDRELDTVEELVAKSEDQRPALAAGLATLQALGARLDGGRTARPCAPGMAEDGQG